MFFVKVDNIPQKYDGHYLFFGSHGEMSFFSSLDAARTAIDKTVKIAQELNFEWAILYNYEIHNIITIVVEERIESKPKHRILSKDK